MRLKNTLLLILLVVSNQLYSQVVKGKVIDYITEKGIANVAIKTNLNTGTTTNENGYFTIDITNLNFLNISFLGYETKTVSIDDLKQRNFIITLYETTTKLDEIQINTKDYSLNEIIEKSLYTMKTHKVDSSFRSNFYQRDFSKFNIDILELELKKNSLLTKKERKKAISEFEKFANEIRNKPPENTKEFYGSINFNRIFLKKKNEYMHLGVIDTVIGFKKTFSNNVLDFKEMQKKAQALILKNLGVSKTYKVKTGLFKVEDSLSLKQYEKELAKKDSFNPVSRIWNSMTIVNKMKVFDNDNEANFLSSKYYKHQLLGQSTFNNEEVFVIYFSPKKSKSKFEGKLFIDKTDFFVSKIIYNYAKGKRGEHLNLRFLLGVKFSENIKEGIVHYEKINGKFYVKYFKETIGRDIYANRPFKFIENSEEENKLKLNFKTKFTAYETTESLINKMTIKGKFYSKKMKKKDYSKKVDFINAEEYETKSWKNRFLVIDYLRKLQ